MQTEQILALLIAERDRLSRAIDALQGSEKRRGRPPGLGKNQTPVVPRSTTAKKTRKLSAAGRKAIADAAKKRWAAIKAKKAAGQATAKK